jgi:hypothetical protein
MGLVGMTLIRLTAETVRHVFQRYAALGSVRLLKEELDAHGIRSKRWTSAAGRRWGGKPLARGALYLMLQNRIYTTSPLAAAGASQKRASASA